MSLSTIADFCGIIGFPIAIITIIQTYREARKSVEAANRVKVEVESFKNQFREALSMSDLARALSSIDEMRRLARHQAYSALPDRMSDTRRALIGVRHQAVHLDEDGLSAFQEMIAGLRDLERQIEGAVSSNGKSFPVALRKSTLELMQRADALHEVLSGMKNRFGE